MAKGKNEKFVTIFRNTSKCEFHDIGEFIIATTVLGGSTFCAFFSTGLHTVESIKKRGSIKLHSIYSNY